MNSFLRYFLYLLGIFNIFCILLTTGSNKVNQKNKPWSVKVQYDLMPLKYHTLDNVMERIQDGFKPRVQKKSMSLKDKLIFDRMRQATANIDRQNQSFAQMIDVNVLS
uniref:Uncharacterized protein n=1 Tax=Clastoptera arizonana TaxID=38151 RepID=A0A1B6DSH3_9HEMI